MNVRRLIILGSMVTLLSASGLHAETWRYPFDKNHSTIGFAAPVLKVSKVTGKFADFKGVILVPNKNDPTTASVEITIQTASIDTGIDDRDTHLRSEEFFDTAKYPEITFKSKQVRKVGDTYSVDGSFTMHGVTKEITFPFRIHEFGKVIGAEAHLTLNRKDYGVAWTRVMDDGSIFVSDEVEIDLYILTRVGTEGEAKPSSGEKKDSHH
jgi:polyisoprenoid-binding protein YceI